MDISFFKALGKKKLPDRYQLIFISLVISCISFPYFDLHYFPGLDTSLPWVFNYFANGHLSQAGHVLFPHGPLAFFLYPLPVGNNLILCTCITFFCSFLLSMNVFRICRISGKENLAFVAVILLLLHAMIDIQLILIGLTLSQVLLFHLTNNKYEMLLALLFCIFNLFIKTYGGIIGTLIVAGEFLNLLILQKNYRAFLYFAAAFLILFFLSWLALFQTLNGSISFLRAQYELSSDNSEAVSFYPENNWFMIFVSFTLLLSIPFFSRDALVRYFYLLMLLPLFAAWKHGMARADDQHVGGFLNFLVFFIFFVWTLSGGKKILVMSLGMISIMTFLLHLATNNHFRQKEFPVFRPFNLYYVTLDYENTEKQKNRESAEMVRPNILPDTILKLIGKNTVDVYPWNYSIIAANNLSWAPRPVIHSYAAYTGWLDGQDAKHILSGNAARFLIWEKTGSEAYDNLGRLAGIDNRYLLNDEPKYIINFFSNYALKFKDPDYLVYEKRLVAATLTSTLSPPEQVAYETWVDVPEAGPDCVVRARLKIKKSFTGKLKSFFYKGEGFSISYELDNKTTRTHKFVPKNAEDGLWLNPFIMNPKSDTIEPVVKKINVWCWQKEMVEAAYTLQFETIRFGYKDQKTKTSFVEEAFHKVKAGAPEKPVAAATP